MDELTYFMEDRKMPHAHRERLRDFFYQTQDFARETGFDELYARSTLYGSTPRSTPATRRPL